MPLKNKLKKFKTLLRVFLLVLCGVVVGMKLYMFNANSIVGNQLPMPFGYGMLVVMSGSMEPTISQGNLIIVNEPEEYEVDDVVVFQDGSMLVTHRIIEMSGNEVVTQGDANNVTDVPIDISAIRGNVIETLPGVGNIVLFFMSPKGIFILIALTLYTTESSFRKKREEDSKELENIKEEISRLKESEE